MAVRLNIMTLSNTKIVANPGRLDMVFFLVSFGNDVFNFFFTRNKRLFYVTIVLRFIFYKNVFIYEFNLSNNSN